MKDIQLRNFVEKFALCILVTFVLVSYAQQAAGLKHTERSLKDHLFDTRVIIVTQRF